MFRKGRVVLAGESVLAEAPIGVRRDAINKRRNYDVAQVQGYWGLTLQSSGHSCNTTMGQEMGFAARGDKQDLSEVASSRAC